MTKFIVHDDNYDAYEQFDKEPTSEELDEFASNHSEYVENITVFEVKKVGTVKKTFAIEYDKCKDC